MPTGREAKAPDEAAPGTPADPGSPASPGPGRRWEPLLGCTAAGLASAVLVLLGEARSGSRALPPAARWGAAVLAPQPWGALAGVAGLAGMVAAWVWLVRSAERLRLRAIAGVAAVWTLPLLVAGPVLSSDGYAYGAVGEQLRRGIDPYGHGPAAMGSGVFLQAMDPGWAHSPAPYGPLSLLLFRLLDQAGGDRLSATLAALRAVVAGATLAAAVLAVRGAARRRTAAAFLAAGPVVTVSLAGALHVDAVAAALAAAAAAAWAAKHRLAAVALAALATAVKASLGVLVLALLIALAAQSPPGRRLRRTAAAAATAAACYLLPAVVVGNPFGLLRALATPYERVGVGSPASVLAAVLRPALAPVLPGNLPEIVVYGVLQAAGLAVAGAALAASRRRNPCLCAGVALLAIVLSSPVLHSWYLAWPLVLLAPVLTRSRVLPWAGAAVAYCVLADAVRPALPPPVSTAAVLGTALVAAAGTALALARVAAHRPAAVRPALVTGA